MVTVLTILPEGFEEIEAITPIDLWRRAGFQVTTASLTNNLAIAGRSGIMVRADTSISSIQPDSCFNLLFLPGGPGVAKLRASPEITEIIGRQISANKWIAAICAAPLVLKDTGVISGRRFTAHPSTATELPDLIPDQRVVVDGKIITSRGAGTALDFALQVIESLADKETSARIALSICA